MPSFPFDPIQRASEVEALVMRGTKRAYYRVRYAERFDCPVTVDSVGCCLQCAYCWNALRNENMTLAVAKAKFYEPEEIAAKAIALAREKKEWRFRVSGCETILGKASTKHFTEFMDAILMRPKGKNAFFLLETNGVMLGYDSSLVKKLAPYKDHLAVRVAIKGENPEMYEKISGANADSFRYQLNSLKLCYANDIPSLPAIMSTFMDSKVISQLTQIVEDDIDQEALKYYPITKKSLIERGVWDMRKAKAQD